MTSGSFGTVNLCAPRKATAPFFPSCTGPCHKATPRIHAATVQPTPHSPTKTGGCRIIRYGSHRQKSGARRSPDTCTSLPEFCGLLSLVSLNAEYAATQRVQSTAFRGCGLRHQTQNGYRAGTRGPHHTPGSPRGKAAGRCPRRIQQQYRRNPRRSWGQHPNQERARR